MQTYFLLLIPLLADGQTTTSTCCNKREIGGTDQNSGIYWLSASGDARCSDGCVYFKENVADNLYCFSSSNKYVIDCSSETRVNVTEYWLNRAVIEPVSLTEPGTYGEAEYCPLDTYAVGFDLQYAPLCARRCARDDDVALMAVRLYCATLDDTTTEIATITSDVLEGYARAAGGTLAGIVWSTKQNCPTNKFIDSSQILTEFFKIEQGETSATFTCPAGIICSEVTTADFDPVGGMNLNVRCNDETQLDGGAVAQAERSELSAWSDWQDCPTNYVVCGIKTKVSAGNGTDNVHNLGITGVMLTCCELPPGYY